MEFICRVCLSEHSGMTELTETINNSLLLNILNDVSGIKIILSPNKPRRICSNCLSQVMSALDIKSKVIEAETYLQTQENGDGELLMRKNKKNDYCSLPFMEDLSGEPKTLHPSDDSDSTKNMRTIKSRFKMPEDIVTVISKQDKPERKNKTPNEMDYKCFICDQVFEKIATKNIHVRSDHEKETACKLCGIKCKTPLSLETHVKYHFRDCGFMCEICSKTFRYKNRLNTHRLLHHENATEILCDLCGLKSKFKNNMKRHMKSVHMKIREFRCDKCFGHHYTTQEALNSHLYRYHNVPAPVNCPDCRLGFTFVSELRAHKKYRFCSNNPKASLTKREKGNYEHLEIMKHTGDHICKLCNVVFPTKTKFSMHNYLKHKYSNKCGQCDILFTNYTSLMRHEKVKHQGQRPFKCEYCSKCFGQKVSLTSHRNTHTGNKTFACEHCSFRSGDHGTVSKHRKKMHSELVGLTAKVQVQSDLNV